MEDKRQSIEYERPDWTSEEIRPRRPPFWCERTDIPVPERKEKGGMGVLVAAIGMLIALIGGVIWTLRGAL